MSAPTVSPRVTHALAAVVRLVDGFTGVPVRERYDVRLTGHEWWTPLFRETDATYRFLVANQPVPALGIVAVTVTPIDPVASHRDIGGLSVTIPPAGPAPVPLDVAHYLVEHAVWPTAAFRPPPGETFVAGRVERAGQPVADQRVRVAAGAPPAITEPAAPTDDAGQFTYRLPGLRVQAATVATVVDTADLFVTVTDNAGAAQALAGPALPITVPIGRPAVVTLVLA